MAKLSSEAMDIKKPEVRLLAVDSERNRYVIDMHQKESNLYELEAGSLPKVGAYELEASITGIKNKKSYKAVSQRLKYTLVKTEGEVQIVKVEEKKIEKPVEDQEPSILIFIGLVTFLNMILGGAAYGFFKKASSGPSITIPVFEDENVAKAAIKTLREKIS